MPFSQALMLALYTSRLLTDVLLHEPTQALQGTQSARAPNLRLPFGRCFGSLHLSLPNFGACCSASMAITHFGLRKDGR